MFSNANASRLKIEESEDVQNFGPTTTWFVSNLDVKYAETNLYECFVL